LKYCFDTCDFETSGLLVIAEVSFEDLYNYFHYYSYSYKRDEARCF